MNQAKCQLNEDTTVTAAAECETGEVVYEAKDVSEYAALLGCPVPVFITRAAWQTAVLEPDDCPKQDLRGRLLLVLTALGDAIERRRSGELDVYFKVPAAWEPGRSNEVTLKAMCCGRIIDEMEILVMLATE